MIDIKEFSKYIWSLGNGKFFQPIMLIEEMAELQKEMTKHLRGGDNLDQIIEEIADVEVVLESIKYGLGIDQELIETIKQQKMERFLQRH
jgi:NTP pyrophosphatase (non-canonical NTP hydrolase)